MIVIVIIIAVIFTFGVGFISKARTVKKGWLDCKGILLVTCLCVCLNASTYKQVSIV